MFANLKNKLIEEVKASPSKFQQFANAAQAAVSSSTSTTPSSSDTTSTTTNENFFSITEEDTPQNSPYKPLKLPPGAVRGRQTTPHALNNGTGAIPRTRRLSNSSMASDISFRLPSYESTAVYHLQSDLDETSSEMDDSASASKLDVITKEQLYDAYRKSLDRYHKYRCRYTDLAKKYKDLERDSTKARSVLVETQDKAIRRINELREQCSLEQQAKAHLEEALRMEMDDMQCKMQAYQTKLTLLGENPENVPAAEGASTAVSEALIQLDDDAHHQQPSKNEVNNLLGLACDAEGDHELRARIAQLEKELQEREQQLQEMQANMNKSMATIELLKKQEEENALLLAQTKQAIHSELENKESEVKRLNDTLKQMQTDLQTATTNESQLSGQVGEMKSLKEKLQQSQLAKKEVDAKIIAAEHMLAELKQQFATKEQSLSAAEERNVTLTQESELKLQELRQQNAQLNEMVQRYQQTEVSLAEIDNELNRTKNENDNLRATIEANERRLQSVEAELNEQGELQQAKQEERLQVEEALLAEQAKVEELQRTLESASAAKEHTGQRVKQLESELRILNEQNASNESETISALKAELHHASARFDEELRTLKEQLASKEKELKSATNKANKQKKQYEAQQQRIKEQTEQIDRLKVEVQQHEEHLQALQREAGERADRTELEKNELKAQVTSILQEISQMEEQMRVVQQSHAELGAEKRNLEEKIEQMQQQTQDANEGTQRWREQLAEKEDKLRLVELKLQHVESENSQLAEKNCLLEENSHRLEKQLAERERQQVSDETSSSEMRVKLETAEDALQKLNEKMSQVLDENTRMQNAQELMDHDYRTLQDKNDALEKEKLLAEDAQQCLRTEVDELKEKVREAESQMQLLTSQLREAESSLATQAQAVECVKGDLEKANILKEKLEQEEAIVRSQLAELRATQSDDDKLRDLLQERQRQIEQLQQTLAGREASELEKTNGSQAEIAALKEQLKEQAENGELLERLREEVQLLREQKDSLTQELDERSTKMESEAQARLEMESKLEELDRLRQECATANDKLAASEAAERQFAAELETHRNTLSERLAEEQKLQAQLASSSDLSGDLTAAKEELRNLKETERMLRAELVESERQKREIVERISRANNDIEKLHESNDVLQLEMDKLKTKQELQVGALEGTLKQLQEEYEKWKSQAQTSIVDAEKLANYEQLAIENEFLNKNVKQLELELGEHRAEITTKNMDNEELKEKLKSMQCELYVLTEKAEEHGALLAEKQAEIEQHKRELLAQGATMAEERAEVKRQTEHANFITEQNDTIQKDLLLAQQQLAEATSKLQSTSSELAQLQEASGHEVVANEKQIASLRTELERSQETIATLNKEVREITEELAEKQQLQDQLKALQVQLDERQSTQQQHESPVQQSRSAASDAELLRSINEKLQRELEDLKYKSHAEISNLQQELQDMHSNSKHMTERLRELEQVSASARNGAGVVDSMMTTNISNANANADAGATDELQEKEELEAKLKQIMNEVQDVSNRNLFLEQKCENFLILEQSNERLKLQNAKLSRQLDETLVSMQHNEHITANTEFEYLKNIMFQYLTGSANGNNETLVKVISAVLKFSPQQTQVAIEKEHQRRSLINKIL